MMYKLNRNYRFLVWLSIVCLLLANFDQRLLKDISFNVQVLNVEPSSVVNKIPAWTAWS